MWNVVSVFFLFVFGFFFTDGKIIVFAGDPATLIAISHLAAVTAVTPAR